MVVINDSFIYSFIHSFIQDSDLGERSAHSTIGVVQELRSAWYRHGVDLAVTGPKFHMRFVPLLAALLGAMTLQIKCKNHGVISYDSIVPRKHPPPHIFLLGAQKAGTSSLYTLLVFHKRICGLGLKEKHYFDDHFLEWTFKGYTTHFESCGQDQFTLDATPYFSVWQAPVRLNQTYSADILRKKKFILILREPVAREFSNYVHRLRECDKLLKNDHSDQYFDVTFSKLCCREVMADYQENVTTLFKPSTFKEFYERGMIEKMGGRYKDLIKHWLEYISRDQLFIVNFQTLSADTGNVLGRIQQFLGMQRGWSANTTLPRENESSHIKAILDCETYDKLARNFHKKNKGLYDFINDDPHRPPSEPLFPPFESTKNKCVYTNTTNATNNSSNSTVIVKLHVMGR